MAKIKSPGTLEIPGLFGARYRTRTCDPMHVKYNRYEYISTKVNNNNSICLDFGTFSRVILHRPALAPVGN
nr:MAG TPA: hypothetical protein [Caudoviricetes sp.]